MFRLYNMRKTCTVLMGFSEVKKIHEDVDVDGMIIIKWIFGK
jgi:hypothetical protein